ncbi:MAG: UTP--glucose-1-phosphate uridylyltransferase [Desulfobacteraceae bacterium]|nr:MAG: UTP--glucose-1-phosphate uridylyltransferase [Desulfobacteraceae bacterium]
MSPADGHSKLTVKLTEFIRKMEQAGIEPLVIQTFEYYYRKVVSGEKGFLFEGDIEPIQKNDLRDSQDLAAYERAGRSALKNAVMIVLNGGLGTSMGLTGAKSLLEAKHGRSFLEITLGQAQRKGVELCFMNSFNTHQDTIDAVTRAGFQNPPAHFVQNKFPKILRIDFSPAKWPQNPDMEWNPPGHGDVYTALFTSGTLQRLLDEGIRYAFISNSDNLGGTMDESLLGYFSKENLPFMMEVAERGPSDIKGGHLARHKNGRLVLREIAQCPENDLRTFQDIRRHRFFNTNNIWINLVFLKHLIEQDKIIHLPMILNPKTIDPRDEGSPPVYQIETAMGSAIFLFSGATAVRVPKIRLLPVKTCNDLLAIRSDRYLLTETDELVPNPQATTDAFTADLDKRYYGKIDLFDERFPEGVPSLKDCRSLTIRGDVRFQKNAALRGSITITNRRSKPAVINEGASIDSDLSF